MDGQYRYCCLLDVLGFKETLDDWNKASEYYQRFVMNILPNIYQMVYEVFIDDEEQLDVNWKVISDSLIITAPDPLKLIVFASYLQYYSFYYGYWTRGCIAYGKHLEYGFTPNYFVVSQALRDAYVGETTMAKYPRIIVHPDAIGRIENALFERIEGLEELSLKPSESFSLIQAEDNLWFVNPFRYRPEGDVEVFACVINEKLAEYCNTGFLDKYLWVGDLHNALGLHEHLLAHAKEYFGKKQVYLDSLRQLHTLTKFAPMLARTWDYSDKFHAFFFLKVPPNIIATSDLERLTKDGSRSLEFEWLKDRNVYKRDSPYVNTFAENVIRFLTDFGES